MVYSPPPLFHLSNSHPNSNKTAPFNSNISCFHKYIKNNKLKSAVLAGLQQSRGTSVSNTSALTWTKGKSGLSHCRIQVELKQMVGAL